MPYSPFELPEFPCKSDLWDRLASEDKPIIVYGMGNGADKLIHRLGEYGVEISDFFASDGFVRGHSFHGKRVKSFSEIKEKYTDFVILLSFATNRDEVLDQLMTINNSYEMYIPDMPVALENEYFDRDFYNCHYSEIITAYNSLSDEYSRNCFAAIVNYKKAIEFSPEYKLEFRCDEKMIESAIKSIKDNHPYEEVCINVIEVMIY